MILSGFLFVVWLATFDRFTSSNQNCNISHQDFTYYENASEIFYRGGCHMLKCDFKFNCKCGKNDWLNEEPYCIDFAYVCDGEVDCKDGASDEVDCYCSDDQYQCSPCDPSRECKTLDTLNILYQCIPYNKKNDSVIDCRNRLDKSGNDSVLQSCTTQESKCDGKIDCPYLYPNDEYDCSGCPPNLTEQCNCYKVDKCDGYGYGNICYENSSRCDGRFDCIDRSDELNCSCEEDEFQCSCLKTDPVTCSTIYETFDECIPIDKFRNGIKDCQDGSDEIQYRNIIPCDNCNITLFRLADADTCDTLTYSELGLEELYILEPSCANLTCLTNSNDTSCLNLTCLTNSNYTSCVNLTCLTNSNNTSCLNLTCLTNMSVCDNSTCFEVPSINCSNTEIIAGCNDMEVICTSENLCDHSPLCRNTFQCEDGSLILANNFCDENYDCPDFSDEITNGYGFKCTGSSNNFCVLPQRNLYDNISQCKNEFDFNCSTECFPCFDKRLKIHKKQVCDEIFDCIDLSDECLCQINSDNKLCNSIYSSINSATMECEGELNVFTNTDQNLISSTILCKNKKNGSITAKLCDDRPECKDFIDECKFCNNPPDFCNDTCRQYYPMGDRYCDGIEDEAWKFINNPNCTKGFDEKNCPKRFKCKAGNKVSIDIKKKCDDNNDCDKGEDEEDCGSLFSSNSEMIENMGLRVLFWIMGFAVIIGNCYVLVTSTLYFKYTKDNKAIMLQRLIVLNISIADIMMGFYMIIISIYSQKFSGIYGEVDAKWKTSLLCSFIGSLSVISSEASCLMMVLLATFRQFQIRRPFAARSIKTWIWKVGIALIWLISILLAVIPILDSNFIQSYRLSNKFMHSSSWDKHGITKFACRLAQLTNKTIQDNGRDWESTKRFLEDDFPKYAIKGEFSYYSETSVCMPRIYAGTHEKAWQYTFFIITLNFLSFLYIATTYTFIYFKATNREEELQNQATAARDKVMQKRIARLILTDFFCWIPICITSYVKISGYDVPNDMYIYSAALLLPINSALNPLLFSPLIEKVQDFVRMKSNKHKVF